MGVKERAPGSVVTKSILGVLFACLMSACMPSKTPHPEATLKFDPEKIEAGKPFEMIFSFKDSKGNVTSDLEIIHEKPLHMFILSNDLSEYFHEHPEKSPDGSFRLPFKFNTGGEYRVFIDFKPENDEQVVDSFKIDVEGQRPSKKKLVVEEKFEKVVDGVRVVMKDADVSKQKMVHINFEFYDDETGAPLTDLEDYLGEKAHFVFVRKGLGRFIHAHPMSGDMKGDDSEVRNATSESHKIGAMASFPNSGIYKVFAQFKRNGTISTVSFVFEVSG